MVRTRTVASRADKIPYVNDEEAKKTDISYKYYPVSVWEVQRMGKLFMRGAQTTSTSSRKTFSPFPTDVAEWVVRYFLRDCSSVFDPYAGWGERHAACRDAGKAYYGLDVSPAAVSHAQHEHGVQNICADSRHHTPLPAFDAVFTCPPYWNVEMFQGDGLHSLKTWTDFLQAYEDVWRRCVEAAPYPARFAVVVGDWRRQHQFYDLTFQTELILHRLGLVPFDKVILSHKRQAPLKAMVYQAKRLGYTCKVHQTLLVYDKRLATNAHG